MPENDTPRAARYPLLTPSQAAERLGVSTRTMQRMLAEGSMPAVQISSKTYRIRPDVIDELLARAALPATEPAIPYRHVAKRPNTLEGRFWRYVEKSDGCWQWTGAANPKGYGNIGRGKGLGTAKAHRVSWELHFGPIPPGLYVCHACDNPPCVRPDHLFLGTAQDNNNDKIAKGRDRKVRL
jgi:excisionase family DNA binding protein